MAALPVSQQKLYFPKSRPSCRGRIRRLGWMNSRESRHPYPGRGWGWCVSRNLATSSEPLPHLPNLTSRHSCRWQVVGNKNSVFTYAVSVEHTPVSGQREMQAQGQPNGELLKKSTVTSWRTTRDWGVAGGSLFRRACSLGFRAAVRGDAARSIQRPSRRVYRLRKASRHERRAGPR